MRLVKKPSSYLRSRNCFWFYHVVAIDIDWSSWSSRGIDKSFLGKIGLNDERDWSPRNLETRRAPNNFCYFRFALFTDKRNFNFRFILFRTLFYILSVCGPFNSNIFLIITLIILIYYIFIIILFLY